MYCEEEDESIQIQHKAIRKESDLSNNRCNQKEAKAEKRFYC